MRMVRFCRSTNDVEMFVNWLACDYGPLCSHAYGGAVARLWTRWCFSINLRQLRKINSSSESIFESGQIGIVPVCRELDPMSQALGVAARRFKRAAV